jgi:hypothetical protein
MKRIFAAFCVICITFVSITGCQIFTRRYGGTTNITLPVNHQFWDCSWKDNNLWVVTYDVNTKKYHYTEYSVFGVIEGEVVIKEQP